MSTPSSLYWAIRRELWESRSVTIAPLAAAAVFLLGFFVGMFHLPAKMRAAAALDPMHQRAAIAGWYDGLSGLIMLVVMVVGIFYCLDALYGERRDRSILFWKSLPVSDFTTVLAKAIIPVIILPFLAWLIALVTHAVMLLMTSAVLASSGQSVSTLWNLLAFPRMSLLLLYHLMTVHSLYIAPIYGWLLFVSAWSRRAPFVWGFVPPIVVCYLEKLAFNTTHLAAVLEERFTGNGMDVVVATGMFPTHPMTHATPFRFMSSPGLWIGLVIFAAFVAAATRLRRYRGPI